MSDDYDFDPRETPSIYLKLKKQGDKILIRIASPPFREPKVWRMEGGAPLSPTETVKLTEKHWQALYRDPEYNLTEAFHWKVINRETGQAQIFTGTAGVYKHIKKFAETPGWGDPKTYDLAIERTESPGPSYYTVTPMPDKASLSDKEEALIEAIDMDEKLPAARRLSEPQIDHIPEMDDQSVPPEEEKDPVGPGHAVAKATAHKLKPSKQEDDIFIEDIGDETINLEDIPF